MPSQHYIFHLSFAVGDLDQAKDFYTKVLEANLGRQTDKWLDVLLWGHQITLQLRPEEVLNLEQQGKRHFGFVLPWDEWQAMVDSIQKYPEHILQDAKVLHASTHQEQGKLFLKDPSNNVIELKTYKNVQDVLKLPNDA